MHLTPVWFQAPHMDPREQQGMCSEHKAMSSQLLSTATIIYIQRNICYNQYQGCNICDRTLCSYKKKICSSLQLGWNWGKGISRICQELAKYVRQIWMISFICGIQSNKTRNRNIRWSTIGTEFQNSLVWIKTTLVKTKLGLAGLDRRKSEEWRVIRSNRNTYWWWGDAVIVHQDHKSEHNIGKHAINYNKK